MSAKEGGERLVTASLAEVGEQLLIGGRGRRETTNVLQEYGDSAGQHGVASGKTGVKLTLSG
jgi:hypothetical protein